MPRRSVALARAQISHVDIVQIEKDDSRKLHILLRYSGDEILFSVNLSLAYVKNLPKNCWFFQGSCLSDLFTSFRILEHH